MDRHERWDPFKRRWSKAAPPPDRRRHQAEREIARFRSRGRSIAPVTPPDGPDLVTHPWGLAFVAALEADPAFAERLARGHVHARTGTVIHLALRPGRIEALVSGGRIEEVEIDVAPLDPDRRDALRAACAGVVPSVLPLLRGEAPEPIRTILFAPATGPAPAPSDLTCRCTCGEGPTACKHVAAALWGTAVRLAGEPESLFALRHVRPAELLEPLEPRPAPRGKAARPKAKAAGTAAARRTKPKEPAAPPPKTAAPAVPPPPPAAPPPDSAARAAERELGRRYAALIRKVKGEDRERCKQMAQTRGVAAAVAKMQQILGVRQPKETRKGGRLPVDTTAHRARELRQRYKKMLARIDQPIVRLGVQLIAERRGMAAAVKEMERMLKGQG